MKELNQESGSEHGAPDRSRKETRHYFQKSRCWVVPFGEITADGKKALQGGGRCGKISVETDRCVLFQLNQTDLRDECRLQRQETAAQLRLSFLLGAWGEQV